MSMGSGGSTPQPVVQKNQVNLSPEQQQLFGLAMPYATQYANSPLAAYTGQTIAGTNADQTAAQEGYKGQVAGINNLGARAATAQQFMLDPNQLDPNSNPYIHKSAEDITNLLGRQLTEQILPNVRSGGLAASGPYGGGSTREQGAERLAGETTQRTTGSTLNDLYSRAYSTGLANLNQSIVNNPTVQAQQLFGSDVLGSVGGQQQAQQQAELTDTAGRWNLQQQLPYLRASELMGLAGGLPGGGATSTVTGANPQAPSVLSSLIGGGASGAALGSAVMPGVGTGVGAGLGALLAMLGRR